jgi:hypothetical protein
MGSRKNYCLNPTFKGCFSVIPLDFTEVIPFDSIGFGTIPFGNRLVEN